MNAALVVDRLADGVGVLSALAAGLVLFSFDAARRRGAPWQGPAPALVIGVALLMAVAGGLLVFLPEGEGPMTTTAAPSTVPAADEADEGGDAPEVTSADGDAGDGNVAPPSTVAADDDAGMPVGPTVAEEETSTTTAQPQVSTTTTTAPQNPPTTRGPPDTVPDAAPDAGEDDGDGEDGGREGNGAENGDPGDRAQAPSPGTSYEVAAGDNFWSIAEAAVEGAHADASSAEVHAYWTGLIEANSELLVEPGNPDLILPGQVFELPPLAPTTPATT